VCQLEGEYLRTEKKLSVAFESGEQRVILESVNTVELCDAIDEVDL